MATLKFSPKAYLHWQFLCHYGPTEASAFGITNPDDGLLVESLWVPKQECTPVFTSIDDESWHDLFDWAYENNVPNSSIGGVWLHTHPNMSAHPSGVDERTFEEKFHTRPLAVMGIISRTNDVYARVKYNVNGHNSFPLSLEVLWKNFPADLQSISEDIKLWEEDYKQKVTEKKMPVVTTTGGQNISHFLIDDEWNHNWRNSSQVKKGKRFKKNRQGTLFVPDDMEEDQMEKEIFRQEFADYMMREYDTDIETLDKDKFKEAFDDYTTFAGEDVDLDEIYPERCEMYELVDADYEYVY